MLLLPAYDALIHESDFISMIRQILIAFQVCGALDRTSLCIAQTFLTSLCMKIRMGMESSAFPVDLRSGPWVQVVLFSDVLKEFLLNTIAWGQHNNHHRNLYHVPGTVAASALAAASAAVTKIRNYICHGKHHHSTSSPDILVFPLECGRGPHMYEAGISMINDPTSLIKESRDRFIGKDILDIMAYLQRSTNILSDLDSCEVPQIASLSRRRLTLYH
uniref:Uncharacterized protein n=1 Tax=Spongospora subterranea TaxID=70186 RepID=A0A0H5QQY3_9EUKA|eukprot:CRZ04485.1 hypothetical protein [Spongospora subterranea]